jgi:hypothetical protein
MGKSCNPRRVPLYSTEFQLNDTRFGPDDVSLHCYIWTSDPALRNKQADLCVDCCAMKVIPAHLSVNATQEIWKCVGKASWK